MFKNVYPMMDFDINYHNIGICTYSKYNILDIVFSLHCIIFRLKNYSSDSQPAGYDPLGCR